MCSFNRFSTSSCPKELEGGRKEKRGERMEGDECKREEEEGGGGVHLHDHGVHFLLVRLRVLVVCLCVLLQGSSTTNQYREIIVHLITQNNTPPTPQPHYPYTFIIHMWSKIVSRGGGDPRGLWPLPLKFQSQKIETTIKQGTNFRLPSIEHSWTSYCGLQ